MSSSNCWLQGGYGPSPSLRYLPQNITVGLVEEWRLFLKEGCDVGHSQRDVFREAGEKNEERGMGPFLIKHVVLNMKYTNTYYIYIYTYLPIFIVHDSYIQFAECPSILRAGTLHHLRSLAQDYSRAVRKLRLVGLCTGWYYAVMWGLSGIILNNL